MKRFVETVAGACALMLFALYYGFDWPWESKPSEDGTDGEP